MKIRIKNRTLYLVLALMTGFLFSLSSCYYDTVEELDPNFGLIGNCDTAGTISFSVKVDSIITTFCGSTGGAASSCHGTSSSSGIPLVSYQDISNAASDKLMDAIRHINGASPMPKGGGKIDNCRIETIQKWINQGKMNN